MEFQLFPLSFTNCFLFIIIIFFFSLTKQYKTSNKKERLPPGPWKLPLIGSIHHLVGSLPHHFLRDLSRRYGPIMHLHLGEITTVVISSPSLAKEILKANELAFLDRPGLLGTEILFYGKNTIAFSPYGDYWRKMRKIVVAEFLGNKNVKSFQSIREKEVLGLIASIRSSLGSPINLTEKFYVLTTDILSKAAFGKKVIGQKSLVTLVKQGIEVIGGFDVEDLFPTLKLLHVIFGMRSKLEQMHIEIDKIVTNIIKERREGWESDNKIGGGEAGKEDLLDVLLNHQENSEDDEIPITDKNIKAIIIDMFAGGSETAPTTLEWAMSEMIRNPQVMEKAQAEVREALKGKETIRESDTQGLSYVKLVIKETLRLHPPAPLLIPRLSSETSEIDGYKIPIKTRVIVNYWAMGRDPSIWNDPESFIPERFETSSIEYTGQNFEYIPFGAGRRICPGISFGVSIIELTIVQLLYHFNWKICRGTKPEDLDMTETHGLTAKRKNPLHLIAT